MEQELNLSDIFIILRKRIILLIVLPLIAVLISGVVSFYILAPVYEASTSLLLGRTGSQIEYSDVMLNRQLVKTYSEVARSRSVLSSTISALRLDMTVGQLQGRVTVSSVRDTEIIAISVRHDDPVMAQRIADQVAASFSEKVIGFSNIENILIVDAAQVPDSPVSPNKMLNIAIAGVLGVMLAVGAAFVLEFLDNTYKKPEELEQALGLSVLVMVPMNGKGGK